MGLLSQPTSRFDANLVDTLQNHLFEFVDENGQAIALDLAATNINRGRDHAIPAYHKYRKFCGFSSINDFNDLKPIMKSAHIDQLRSIYSSVKDIDLFVGGLHEAPVDGALVGPTFGCLISKQFEDLKKGDRFYYENGGSEATRFSLTQLDEIRQVSMAGLVCRNIEGVINIQPQAFKMPNKKSGNGLIKCKNIQQIHLKKWRV